MLSLTIALVAAMTSDVGNTTVLDTRTPFLRIESNVRVGNKGEEVANVSTPLRCGENWVYDHAELVVTRNRFGAVEFTQLPTKGCFRCEPLRVRWYHEPTGYLTFDVIVYRHKEHVAC